MNNRNSKPETSFWRQSAIFIIGLALMVFFGVHSYRSVVLTQEKLRILNEVGESVEDLRLENLRLLMISEYVSTDDYVEEQARDKLNLSKDGEVIFIISDELMVDPVVSSYIDSFVGYEDEVEVEQIDDKSSYEIWLEFLF